MFLTVTPDGGAPMMFDPLDIVDMIPLEIPFAELLRRVVVDHETVHLVFKDGSAGSIAGPALQQIQLLLPAPTQPSQPLDAVRGFEADVRLYFEVPAIVHCQGLDKKRAVTTISDVFSGLRTAPQDFSVEVDREYLLHLVASLDHPLLTHKHLSGLSPTIDLNINRIEER